MRKHNSRTERSVRGALLRALCLGCLCAVLALGAGQALAFRGGGSFHGGGFGGGGYHSGGGEHLGGDFGGFGGRSIGGDGGYHGENGYHPQGEGGYHPQGGGGEYHPQAQNYHPQNPGANGYHPQAGGNQYNIDNANHSRNYVNGPGNGQGNWQHPNGPPGPPPGPGYNPAMYNQAVVNYAGAVAAETPVVGGASPLPYYALGAATGLAVGAMAGALRSVRRQRSAHQHQRRELLRGQRKLLQAGAFQRRSGAVRAGAQSLSPNFEPANCAALEQSGAVFYCLARLARLCGLSWHG